MRGLSLLVATLVVAFAVGGCDSGTKWRSGKYKIYWIDISSNLTLGYNLGNGGAIGRVMPRVISVGEDVRWMVAARHPEGDKTKTEYFYFSKVDDGPYKNSNEIVQGPFTQAEFERKSKELDLPPLTKHF